MLDNLEEAFENILKTADRDGYWTLETFDEGVNSLMYIGLDKKDAEESMENFAEYVYNNSEDLKLTDVNLEDFLNAVNKEVD